MRSSREINVALTDAQQARALDDEHGRAPRERGTVPAAGRPARAVPADGARHDRAGAPGGSGQPEAVAGRGRGVAQAPAPGRGPSRLRSGPQPTSPWMGATLSNVVLSLQHGVNVSGQIAFEGADAAADGPDPDARDMSPVGARRRSAAPRTARWMRPDASPLPGVPPGRYRLSASGRGRMDQPSRPMIGGQDALDFPFEVKGNQNVSGAVITFTDQPTELTGKVVDASQQPAGGLHDRHLPGRLTLLGRKLAPDPEHPSGDRRPLHVPQPAPRRVPHRPGVRSRTRRNVRPGVPAAARGDLDALDAAAGETKTQDIRVGGG